MVEALTSVYGFMASWLTPSYLFLFINLVIGTIAITSRYANPRPRVDSPQLVRSPSLLHRLMSFNLGSHNKYQPPTTIEETEKETHENPVPQNHDPTRLDLCRQESPCPNPDGPTQDKLTRAPSLIERVMSVKFYRSRSIEAEKNEPASVSGSGSNVGGNESDHGYLGGVDEKADDFIKRFKEQLRLQRLDSILRYRDMLKGN